VTPSPSLPFDEPTGRDRPRRTVLSVTELTARVRMLLESAHPEVWVEGEIANSRLWKTGHRYFTLRDDRAQLKGVMFRSAARSLRFAPEDGLRVVARGRLSVYEPKGEYQIVCEHLQPQGVGALQIAFDQLRRRLEEEGLLDPARKRRLPLLPRVIGVVTSLDGAAIRDVLQVLARRHPTARVLIAPTRVQGEGAAGQIAGALERLGAQPDVDVVIVGRGGGSIEDLWAFNEAAVARAIAACPVPVISAVGHETDVTISDLVADHRAPTPSAAAELVVAHRTELRDRVGRLASGLRAALRGRLGRQRTRVLELDRRPGLAGWSAGLASRARHAAELTHALEGAGRALLSRRDRRLRVAHAALEARDPGRRLEARRTRLVAARTGLHAAWAERRQRSRARLSDATGRLEALSPVGVLARGYAVCWNADHTAVIRNAAAVSVGEGVSITLGRGRLQARVTGKD